MDTDTETTYTLTQMQERAQQLETKFGLMQQELAQFAEDARMAMSREAQQHGEFTWMRANWMNAHEVALACKTSIGQAGGLIHGDIGVIERALKGERVWKQYTPSGATE